MKAVLIGGPNGAGKTTFARAFIPMALPNAVFLNADEVGRETGFAHPARAGREMLTRLRRCVTQGRDFVLESTLASRSYARMIPEWRARGYGVELHFLEAPSADFCLARVAKRVAAGGHDVPEPDVRRRFKRGQDNFRALYKSCVDAWYHWRWIEEDYGLVDQG